jgi:membrane protein implicated in regulation of membrane protease activity
VNLPDWFEDWQAWLALAILLGVAELFSLDLVLLMLAGGALVGVVVALLGLPVAVQVIAAVAASVGMLALVRPSVVRRLHTGPELTLGHAALVGKQGVVVSEVSADAGQVRINGELWTARPYDETRVIPQGARVDVLQIKGATALVHEVPQLDT